MLQAQDTQFTLAEDGSVCYQPQASNPMPGEPIARVVKSDDILRPKVQVLDSAAVQDKAVLRDHLDGWLARYIKTVLEPLVALGAGNEFKPAVKGIAFQVHEALGIVPREQLEDLIAQLDTDDRRDLRSLKIRLGPILVFIPALNKPAAVRLRALLWGLFNDKALPMLCPNDGIVSFEIDPKEADRSFCQAIAYPVYGSRAIRIDMMDRVISAVYDGAKDGKFQAEHKMAEWLGSSIEGLYDVLEAMGHKKIFDPALEAAKTEATAEDATKDEASEGAPVEEAAPTTADAPAESAKTDVKPELATFRLKKGKAFAKAGGGYKKAAQKDKPEKAYKGKRNKSTSRTPKVMSAGPKLENSPFAVLEQLKQKSSSEKSNEKP